MRTRSKEEFSAAGTEYGVCRAYMDEAHEIVVESVKQPGICMRLGEDEARSNYSRLQLHCVNNQLVLIYICYEPVHNSYLLGARCLLPEKREEVIYTSSRRDFVYDTFWQGENFFLCLQMKNGEIRMWKRRDGGFEEV